jgi:general secretion pathway protein H
MRAKEAGFTLVEMLVVLALVAVTAAVSLPYSLTGGEARKLDAFAQTVVAKLNAAQIKALSSNEDTVLRFDVARGLIVEAGPDPQTALPRGITLQVTTSKDEVILDRAAIRFFPNGGSTGGTIILSKDDQNRIIAINWLTGAIKLSHTKPR